MKFRIKEIAKEKGISQGDLATAVDIHSTSLSRIVNGGMAPSLETLANIADALGVHISELFYNENIVEEVHQNYCKCPHCGKPISIKIDDVE